KDKAKIIKDVSQLVLARRTRMCNFIEYKDTKIVYRRYASLFFIAATDPTDNELLTLEIVHRYVEQMDKYYGNVCELDIIFNFQKAYFILDELLLAGELQESSKKNVLRVIGAQDGLEEMEYLPLPDFDVATNALNFSTPDCHIIGGCDLYTTKAAGKDKKLYKDIENSLESQYESLVRLSASLSPPCRALESDDGRTNEQGGRRKKRSLTMDPPEIDLSRASPFGPLSQITARRTFAYLIATLNASHPDYDFSHTLRPTDFRREPSLRRIMHNVDSTLQNLRPRPTTLYLAPPTLSNSMPVANSFGNEVWSPRMWSLIDKEMGLRQCDKYAYVPDEDPFDGDEGSIWSMHYFFFNKQRKRVCYLYLRGLSVISHSPVHAPTLLSRPLVERKASEVTVGEGAGKRASYWFDGNRAILHDDIDTTGYGDDDDDEMIIEEPDDDEVEVPDVDLDEIRSDLADGYYGYDAEDDGFDALNESKQSPVYTAGQELERGIHGIFGKRCGIHHGWHQDASSIVVGTLEAYVEAYGDLENMPSLLEDGFWLCTKGPKVQILGQNERGALYGAFEYLSMLAQGNMTQVAYASSPSAPVRWTNEWDNMDGSIERGFAGNSIFFADGGIVGNLTRAAEYARLLSSIRINAVVVNNVNANATLLSPENLDGLARIADVFRPYGVQVGISLYFSSPSSAVPGQANLTTFDPLDDAVISWWGNVTEDIYERIPDFAGYLVKANSEGQPGPLTYNRTLAQGANLFAERLKSHGGIVMFRAFVYDNTINETNWYNDRANAAVDFFKPLDGQFDENVIVQIKYGPIDFQVREPASPLFVNIPNTNTAIELQITQEYLGQQCHLLYWAPLWKLILDTDLRADHQTSYVKDIMSMESWPAYENYSGNLGIQTLNDILYTHYGPNPQTLDGNGWGQWTRADGFSIGMDRTVSNGTGFAGQYPEEVAQMYEDIATTPDNYLLWFHHVNYTHILKSGATVIQDFYDQHYAGAQTAQTFVPAWKSLEGKIDNERYTDQLFRQVYQAGHSIVWRDAIANYYHNLSGIPDKAGRVGHYPSRIEAENMILDGYEPYAVSPFEVASNYTAIVTTSNMTAGTASTILDFDSGTYDIAVNYYDMYGGASHYSLMINNDTLGEWTADAKPYIANQAAPRILGHTPSIYVDGHSAIRITFSNVTLNKGDMLKIIGTPDGNEPAPLDYVSVLQPGKID
ncbi:glycoside hydrolase family 67 protein, partial [Hortaea werneckii]